MVAAFEEPRGLEEKERMKRTKRERDAKPLQRNASYLWSSVWQTSRETLCFFSAARLSIASSSHSLFFLPDPFLHISLLFNVSVTLLLILQSLVLLTHTKAKLHQCMWIDPGDVSSCVRSSNPSPHGCSTPSMFCSFCQLHNTCLPWMYSNTMFIVQLVIQQIDSRNNTFKKNPFISGVIPLI